MDRWLGVVGKLLSPSFPAEAIRPLTESFGELLRREFAPEVFTPETAVKVAEAKRFGSLPSWDIVAGTLREHVRENRPITFGRLPAPRTPDWPDPTPEQVAEVERMAAEFRQWRSNRTDPQTRADLRDVTLSGARLDVARERAERGL